ncbi:MAG: hypothetical protein ACOZQL_00445 [Myxococcota bacterium]
MHRLTFLVLLVATLARAQTDGGLAAGWYVSGKQVSAYAVSSLEPGACGGRAARVASRAQGVKGPLAVMQTFRADDYRGARVRYSATVDARQVSGWAGLFLRADGAARRTLAFDDMNPRPLRGEVRCARVFVVADVPKEAEVLSLGLALHGEGQVELSDVSFERVDARAVPLTSGVHHVHGRVDDVWFTGDELNTNQNGQLRLKLLRRAPGQWADSENDAEVTVEGDRVRARLFSALNGTPQLFTGDFVLKHRGGVTTIEGEWGTALARYPLTVSLTSTKLDMKWGFYERHLMAEPAPQLREGCVFFAQRASATGYSDALEVCGAMLSPTPPPATTVMAFLMEGFRRLGNGLPMPQAPVAPRLPDSSSRGSSRN